MMKYSGTYFIVGTTKSGTTSLFEYIVQHPRVARPIKKEIRYLNYTPKSMISKRKYINLLAPNPPYREDIILGEASGYFNKHDSIEKLSSIFPQAKIFVLFRNPITRIWSWYLHQMRSGSVRPFDEEVYQNFTNRSMFHDDDNMENLLSYYDRDQIMVIKSEEMFQRPDRIMEQVFSHMQISPCKVDARPRNQSRFSKKKKQGMPLRFQERLKKDYAKRASRLYRMIGRDLHWFK